MTLTAMLPDGVKDIGPSDAQLLSSLRTALLNEFELWGYREVIVPALELTESTTGAEPRSSRVETYSAEMLYRLFDRKGRVLVLRPDITEPVARMACSGPDVARPQRFSYFGNAFRRRQAGTGQPHEIWQAGFELIGIESPFADAEALMLGLEALRRAGVEDATGCIGYPAIAASLAPALKRLPPSPIAELLARMDEWFAAAEQGHLAHLRCLAGALVRGGVVESFVFDISLAREMTYYSGPTFEFYSPRAAGPVAGGGRYDGLCSKFGRDLPATGLAIDVLQVMAVLRKGNERVRDQYTGTLIGFEEGSEETAAQLASSLRRAGRVAEVDPLAKNPFDLLKSATAKHRETALFVTRQGYQEFAVAGDLDGLGRRSAEPAAAGVH